MDTEYDLTEILRDIAHQVSEELKAATPETDKQIVWVIERKDKEG